MWRLGSTMRADWKDLGAGSLYFLFGVLGLLLGRDLPVGQASAMGPGYVPHLVSFGLIGIGVAMGGRGLRRRAAVSGFPRFAFGIAALVFGSVLAFAFALERFGVILATALLVSVAAFAGGRPRLRETVALIVSLSLLVVLVFVKGLSVHMALWPW